MSKGVSNKKKKIILNVIIVVLVAVLIFSGYRIGSYIYQDLSNRNMYSELEGDYVSYDNNSSTTDSSAENSSENSSDSTGGYKQVTVPSSINFTKLLAQNKDVVGWIFSKNGIINYPVLQGNDNNYYLNHLISGKKNINGSIYMDCVNAKDFSDYNTIIYGHSMDNGSMFASILKYKKQAYYNAYPEMYIFTPNGNYKLVIFSAYESTTADIAYNYISSSAGRDKMVAHAFNKSKIKTNVTVGANDKIVTLSTCAYSSKDARFLVIGKLVPYNAAESNENSSAVSSAE